MKHMLAVAVLLGGLSAAAHAELVVVANPGVALGSLSQSQLTRLFLGQTEDLPNGAKATPVNVSGESQDQFAKQILKRTPEQVEKYWARMVFTGKAKPPREVKPGDVKATVAGTPGAISYMDRDKADASVKILAITPN